MINMDVKFDDKGNIIHYQVGNMTVDRDSMGNITHYSLGEDSSVVSKTEISTLVNMTDIKLLELAVNEFIKQYIMKLAQRKSGDTIKWGIELISKDE